MSKHNYYSFSLNLNQLMNGEINIESQFKSKLKQYCLSRFYQIFLQNNISCLNDIALLDKSKLKAIEHSIFSFGKYKLKQKHFEMFIRDVTLEEDYKIDMYDKITSISNNSNKEKKEDENGEHELNNISQFNVSMVSPTLTATTALTTQFGSSISINESTIYDGETILLGSIANTYTAHDTTSDTPTIYNNNNAYGRSNEAQYFRSRSFQESRTINGYKV